MAGYGGYFLQGLSSGIQSGAQLGMQIQNLKWQKEQKKQLEKQQEELKLNISNISNIVTQSMEDGVWSDEELNKFNTMFWAGSKELQETFKQAYTDINKGQKEAFNRDLEVISLWNEIISGMNLEDLDSAFEMMRQNIKTPEGQIYFDAFNEIQKKKQEAMANQPQVEVYPSVEALRQVHGDSAAYEWNSNAGGYVPKYESGKEPTPLSQKDLLAINLYEQGKVSFDSFLKYMGMSVTSDNKSALQEKIDKAIQLGASQNEIKDMVLGKSGGIDDEMTAGEKRVIDVGNQVLFGETDIFSGIQKPPLIPNDLNTKINRGVAPTTEEINQVLISWNSIKDNYNPTVQNYIESQLLRYGITPEKAVTPSVEPTPEPEKNPSTGEKIYNWVGKKLGYTDNQQPPEITEPPPTTPNTKELEAPKNPALYTPEINKWIENDKTYTKQNPGSLEAIQRVLKERGYWNYEITGKWTELLENALRMFYRDNPQ